MTIFRTENRRANAWRRVAALSAIALFGAVFGVNVAKAADPLANKIYTWQDLYSIRYNLSGSYVLMNDLTETSTGYDNTTMFNPSEGWTPIGTAASPFTGVFDGDGHTISGLWIDRPEADYQGLFGVITGGTVKNLGVNIVAPGITGNWCVGGIAGRMEANLAHPIGGNIIDCYVTGNVSSVCATNTCYVGGLTGWARNSTLSGCYMAGEVSGVNTHVTHTVTAGGLVGVVAASIASGTTTITNCYATGKVSGSGRAILRIGGLAGFVADGADIIGCYATSEVSCYSLLVSGYVGGLVGNIDTAANSSIRDSFALNSSVADTSKNITSFRPGRITGSSTGTLSNNFALATMTVSTNHVAYTPVPGHDLVDGADISATAAAVGRAAYEASGWDFVNTWVEAPYAGFAHGPDANLPILRAFPDAEQNPHVAGVEYDWYYVDDDDTWDYAPYIYYKNVANGWMFLVEKLPDGASLSVTNCVQVSQMGPDILDFSGSVEHGYKLVNFGDGTMIFRIQETWVTELTLPETATNIAANAFRDLPALAGSLTIPDAVVNIGDYAFRKCAFDGTLTLGDPVASQLTTIGNNAFNNNAFTGDLVIPDAVVTIGDNAFVDNAFTGDLVIPDAVETIGDYAFENCPFGGILSFGTPASSLVSVGMGAFQGSEFEDVSSWGSLDRIFTHMFAHTTFTTDTFVIPAQIGNIANTAFPYTAFGGDIIVGNGVTNIEQSAFTFASFDRISLPSTGVSYGPYVFYVLDKPSAFFYRGDFPADPGSILYFNSPGVTSYVTTAWVDDWNANSLANAVANGVDTSLGIIQTELATWHGQPILCGDWTWDDESLEYTVYLEVPDFAVAGNNFINNEYTTYVTVKKDEPMPPIVTPEIPSWSGFGPQAGMHEYYTFLGYTNSAGIIYYYGDGISARDWDQKGGGTLYAVVLTTVIPLPRVTFYGNGGLFTLYGGEESEWTTQTVSSDGFLPPGSPPYYYSMPEDPKRPGWTFVGWNSMPDGSGDEVEPGDPFFAYGGLDEPTPSYLYAQWTEGEEGEAETWVHVDAINVSPGGDVMLAWAYAPVTNLLRTASYTYVYFVSTDLVTWDEVPTAPVELRDVGGTQDQATLYDTTLPPSNRRFFKVKAVK